MRPLGVAARVVAVCAALGAVGAFVHAELREPEPSARAARRADVARALQLGAELERELLRSSSGLVLHYDALGRTARELDLVLARLRAAPSPLAATAPELAAALAVAESAARDTRAALERFKSDHALLRHSRQLFPELAGAVREALAATAHGERLGPPLVEALGALAWLDVAPTDDVVRRLLGALDELERAAALGDLEREGALGDSEPRAPRLARDVGLLIRHGRLVARHAPLVRQRVSELLASPLGVALRRVGDAERAGERRAAARAQARGVWSAVLVATALVLGLLEVIAELRARARALERARRELERANRGLEVDRARERSDNERKTRFVSRTSHELRTPLAAILSSSRMLASYGERWDAERRATHLERISSAARHMTKLMDDLLFIGRAEVGALVAAPEKLDLHEFCRGLVERSRAREAEVGVPLGPIRFSFRGRREAHLDERLLTHVLGNLLDNAVKYSLPGSEVALHVTVFERTARFVVQDSGIGIRPEDRPHVFDSYHRGRNVGEITGTGLGLSVAKRALDALSGRIEVRSELGKGTEVVVWVPTGAPPASEPGLTSAAPPDAAAAGRAAAHAAPAAGAAEAEGDEAPPTSAGEPTTAARDGLPLS